MVFYFQIRAVTRCYVPSGKPYKLAGDAWERFMGWDFCLSYLVGVCAFFLSNREVKE